MQQQDKASKTPSPRVAEETGTRKHSPWTAPRYRKKNKAPGAAADDSHPLAQLPESPEGTLKTKDANRWRSVNFMRALSLRWGFTDEMDAGYTSEQGAVCMDEDLLMRLDGVSITSPLQAATATVS